MKKVGKITRPVRYDLNQIAYDNTVEVMYRFKGLGLVDSVNRVNYGHRRTIVQEPVTKVIPKKEKCKKGCLRRLYN